MKVTLAYAYAGHEPDETIELPDADAQRLVNDGKARKASKYVHAEKVEPQPEPDNTHEEH